METVLSDFLKKYPNARLNRSGYPDSVCPENLDEKNYISLCEDFDLTIELCQSCWNQEKK